MTSKLVTCPNCHGKSSAGWPFGRCTICSGSGKTTEEKAAKVIAARKIPS